MPENLQGPQKNSQQRKGRESDSQVVLLASHSLLADGSMDTLHLSCKGYLVLVMVPSSNAQRFKTYVPRIGFCVEPQDRGYENILSLSVTHLERRNRRVKACCLPNLPQNYWIDCVDRLPLRSLHVTMIRQKKVRMEHLLRVTAFNQYYSVDNPKLDC